MHYVNTTFDFLRNFLIEKGKYLVNWVYFEGPLLPYCFKFKF